MDVKQSQKAGNNAIQIQQTVVGDNNYVVGIEIENDSRKPNDNQPKRSLLRRLAAFLNDPGGNGETKGYCGDDTGFAKEEANAKKESGKRK